MPKIKYIDRDFKPRSLELIARAERFCNDYARQGLTLTLRQLYYRFVASAIIPNNQREYKNLGNLINDARLAGLIDWNHLEDRTRNLRRLSSWTSPASIIDSAAASYHLDHWADQDTRVEVWIEKDALVGVVERACDRWDVPYFSCRGYTSQSELWGAAQRHIQRTRRWDKEGDHGQDTLVIHLGDHDPSGIDMTRDIEDRLRMFGANRSHVRRIALNYDQVEQYDPPPNPAKLSDSRADKYIERFGDDSWELDALEPRVLDELIETNILAVLDRSKYDAIERRQESEREALTYASREWSSVVSYLVEEKGLEDPDAKVEYPEDPLDEGDTDNEDDGDAQQGDDADADKPDDEILDAVRDGALDILSEDLGMSVPEITTNLDAQGFGTFNSRDVRRCLVWIADHEGTIFSRDEGRTEHWFKEA